MNECQPASPPEMAERRPRAAEFAHRLSGWCGWTALAASVAIYAGVSVAIHEPFHAGGLRLRFFDLRIYHLAALRLAQGSSLYATPMLHHLGFTYPPFAALVMAPLAWVPLPADELAITTFNLLLLVWIMRGTLLLIARRDHTGRVHTASGTPAAAWSQAAGLAAAAMWLEPVTVTLGYGQIDLLITALVVFDLSRSDDAWSKGVAVGLAAAIKLTPLLFIAYLLFSRRGRAATVAATTFAGSIALSFLLLTQDALAYWFHTIFETGRIGNAVDPIDQSLHGVIARLTGTPRPGAGWELLIIAVALGGLGLAVRASRHGDESVGFSLAALSALLASPISWSHHWTLAVPALVVLSSRACERRSRGLAAAAVILGIVGYAYLPEVADGQFGSARGLASLPTTDPYPLIALLVLAAYAASPAQVRVRLGKLAARVARASPGAGRGCVRPQPASRSVLSSAPRGALPRSSRTVERVR